MDQPLAFQLLESKDESLDSLEGIAMELEDSLYPLLREVRLRQAGALTFSILPYTTNTGNDTLRLYIADQDWQQSPKGVSGR